MMRYVVLVGAVLLLIVLFASGGEECRDSKCAGPVAVEVKLVCAELCKTRGEIAFQEKTFRDTEEVRIFEAAIQHREEIPGILDYGVMFRLQVSYSDDSVRNYYLNLDRDPDSRALLVEVARSEQGYTIPRADEVRLRSIIY